MIWMGFFSFIQDKDLNVLHSSTTVVNIKGTFYWKNH